MYPFQIAQWKRQLVEASPATVEGGGGSGSRKERAQEALIEQLYQQIGQLKVEVDWLRKQGDQPLALKQALSVVRQCTLLNMARSSWYYTPRGESAENLELMRKLDEQYTRTPFYGMRSMTAWLQQQGYTVNHQRVERSLRLMGLEALYPIEGAVHQCCLYESARAGGNPDQLRQPGAGQRLRRAAKGC